jgi:hypothetical protein
MADAEKLAFEDRNSRLIYALDSTGNTAILKRVQESSVLISGLKGVGIEVGTRRRIVWSLAAVPSPWRPGADGGGRPVQSRMWC